MKSFGALFGHECPYKPYPPQNLVLYTLTVAPPHRTNFGNLVFFFVKMCKISEIRIPCRFRTLRSTASGEAVTGETVLNFVNSKTTLQPFLETASFCFHPQNASGPSPNASGLSGLVEYTGGTVDWFVWVLNSQ